MDVTPLLTVRAAPRAVLDQLPARAGQVRFRVRNGAGAWTAVTWDDFAAQLRAVAAWLAHAGIAPGDRCAVYAPNSVAWAAAALGIQAAGGVMVPIYPASTAAQVAYVVGHAGARAVFVAGADQRARLAEVRGDLTSLAVVAGLDDEPAGGATPWTELMARGAELDRASRVVDERLDAIDLDAPGLMLYTSGTSGNPKGVPLSHRNVGVNAVDWLRCNAPLLELGYRDLLWLPMSHIFGFGELCLGNTLGWESWMTTPADALALLPEVAPQVFLSVPAYWEKLARAVLAEAGDDAEQRRRVLARITGGRLRFCLSGGAGLKLEIKELLRDAGVLVIEGYGLTETSPTLTLNRPDDYRFDAVGKPLPSIELRLDDDGEILARGPSVFRGYYADDAATAAAFTDDGWFRTGDVGRWTEDGFLQIVDRKKDILVTAGGKNVPPANIEARFADDPVVERCVVFGDARPYLVAAVWVNPTVPAAERDARVRARIEAVNAGLARFETIKKWWIADEPLSVDGGTLTSSLKLRRKAVYDRWRDRFEALYA
ncbi:MAG: long-chain fatty acid--CoA ligase [Kofleriaceae bacterium]|nr:long-chain fatty acid--CoA ligase [Kofleriaceae bacterium]